ncbi:MAG: hypothetical protein EOP48_15990, partial [Sphingobacteriales bacterium]
MQEKGSWKRKRLFYSSIIQTMTEKEFLVQVHKRLAQIAVGASALRNQGAPGLIKAARHYLENKIVLENFFKILTDENKMDDYTQFPNEGTQGMKRIKEKGDDGFGLAEETKEGG